jgi:hypothetical protein
MKLLSREARKRLVRPKVEEEPIVRGAENRGSVVGTYGRTIHFLWDEIAAVTPFGHVVFLIEFLRRWCCSYRGMDKVCSEDSVRLLRFEVVAG